MDTLVAFDSEKSYGSITKLVDAYTEWMKVKKTDYSESMIYLKLISFRSREILNTLTSPTNEPSKYDITLIYYCNKFESHYTEVQKILEYYKNRKG